MVSKNLGIYGFLSVAALTSAALVGCGGSSSPGGAPPIVTTTGGLTNSPGTVAAGATSQPTPQPIPVTVNGTVETATLPANETVAAGGTVSVIPAGTPIINGLTLTPKSRQSKGAPTVANMVQGEVDVDGCNTGLTVTSNGSLSGNLALAPGINGSATHTIVAWGPFNITNTSGTETLTVNTSVTFGVTVNADGVSSIPTSIASQLPANSGSLRNGNYVTVTYPTPDFAGGSGQLTITWPGFTITQSKVVAAGSATFKGLANGSEVPSTGISSLTYTYVP